MAEPAFGDSAVADRPLRLATHLLGLLALTVVCAVHEARAWLPDSTLWGAWQAGSGWLGHDTSAIPTATGWIVYSNVVAPPDVAPCPGKGCPGLVRFEGPSLVDPRLPMRSRVVFRNEAIDDLVDARGRRLPARMLTRAVVRPDPGDGSRNALLHASDGYERGCGPCDGRASSPTSRAATASAGATTAGSAARTARSWRAGPIGGSRSPWSVDPTHGTGWTASSSWRWKVS